MRTRRAGNVSAVLICSIIHSNDIHSCILLMHGVRYIFYDGADGVILVHDLTNRNSHDNLKKWLKGMLTDRTRQEKKLHSRTNSEDYGIGFDSEMYTDSAIPAIVVGTKKDLSRSSNELLSHSSLANDINAQVVSVNCRKASNWTPGAPEMQCFNTFFDKVIELSHCRKTRLAYSPFS